jgi:hypothetical protein
MKKLLLFLNLSFITMSLPAQTDSWKIKWGKKIILEAVKEDEAANTQKINKAGLGKPFFLEISYTEADPKSVKALRRSFLLFDETDKELLKKDSTRSAKISAAELKKFFGDKTKIKIYTVAIPTNPRLAATVRVRRVHLCTLELQ